MTELLLFEEEIFISIWLSNSTKNRKQSSADTDITVAFDSSWDKEKMWPPNFSPPSFGLCVCRKLLEGEECRLSSVGGAMVQSGYPGFSYMSARTYSLGAYRKSKPEDEEEEAEEEEKEEEEEEGEEEEGEEGEEGDDQEDGEGEGDEEEEEEEEEEKPKEKGDKGKEKEKESSTGKSSKS